MGPLYYPRITSDPTYYILSARRGCQVPSGDDNDTHKNKYKEKGTDKNKYKEKVLQRLIACYIFEKHGAQGFEILYWLSSANNNDTTHKCKDKNKVFQWPMVWFIFKKNRGFSDIKYNIFLSINLNQNRIHPRFRGSRPWIFFRMACGSDLNSFFTKMSQQWRAKCFWQGILLSGGMT